MDTQPITEMSRSAIMFSIQVNGTVTGRKLKRTKYERRVGNLEDQWRLYAALRQDFRNATRGHGDIAEVPDRLK